ncbi:ABC transporter permease [Aureimonas psammosilenae]|uniref:ABC transporter permease n=1 Tax=Aureimonas psammosilenae TaxID=2495496 RepID=UPI00126063D5|nr:iron ABC transporter permease [Aureimonas psammosilenae]
MPASRQADAGERLILLATVGFVALVSVVPLARLLWEAFAPGGRLDTGVLASVLSSRSTWIAAWHSVKTAVLGSAISLVLGGAFACLVVLFDLRAKGALVFAFLTPLMIPPQISALAFAQLGGPASPLLRTLGLAPKLGTPNPFFSEAGIVLVLGIQHAPLVFLAVRTALRALPREQIEAARASGAGRLFTLRTVILPLMTPALVAGGALAFVSAIGNFGIPAFLGIPAGYTVLPTLIYQRLASFGPSIIAEAAVLSILIGCLAALGFAVQALMLRRRDFRLAGSARADAHFPLRHWRLPAELLAWGVIALILVAPLSGLLATSLVTAYGVPLSSATVTLQNFAEVLFRQDATVRAFRNSFLLAGGAALFLMCVAVPFAYLVTWKRGRLASALNMAAEVPYALPGIVLGIAAILLFIRPLPLLGVSLYNTIWIIFLAYLARFLVLAARPVAASLLQIDRALEEAARMTGAGFAFRLRTVVVPLLAPATAAGGLLVFMTAFNELTVSALLWSAGNETLGVVVFNLEDAGRSVLAAAVSVVSVAVTVALMLLASVLGKRLPPGTVPWRN